MSLWKGEIWTHTQGKVCGETQAEGLEKAEGWSDAAINPETPQTVTATHQKPGRGKEAFSPTGCRGTAALSTP